MKKFSLFTGFLFATFSLMAQTNIGGAFNSNTALTAANSPYIVTDNITVNAGITLTVEPGVELRFNSGKHIVVYGSMEATDATFTANNSTAEGFWDGLYVGYEYGNDYGNISLDHCHLVYAQSIRVRKGTLTLTNNMLIENFSSYGVNVYTDGSLNLEQTTIRGCSYPVYFSGNGQWNTGDNLTLTGNDHDYIYLNFRDINNTLVCKNTGIPYYYDSELRITTGGLLYLYPGVSFLGSKDAWINVNGKLKALGVAADSVVFDHEPSYDYWQGINIREAVDTACVMTYCKFTGARYSYYNQRNSELPRCAVEVIKSSPVFEHCLFTGNRYNLVVTGQAFPVFSDSKFMPSVYEGAQTLNINMDMNAGPVFNNCSVDFNNSEGRALGIIGSTVYHDAHLRQVSFTDLDNITFTLEGNVVVQDTASLIIDPGIVIKCKDNDYYLSANGPLTGIGTETNPIVFTHINDDNYGNPGDTYNDGTSSISSSTSGRVFLNSTAPSHLKYWKILYAGRGDSYYSITLRNNNILENCDIRNTYRAILFSGNARILNNYFENISYFPLAREMNDGSPVLLGNSFSAIGYLGVYIDKFLGGTYAFGGLDFAGHTNLAYIIDNTMTVPANADVSLLPGTVFKFREYYGKIVVHGGLKAQGEENERIIFTSLYDNSVSGNTNFNGGDDPTNHKWSGMEFAGDSHDSINMLSHCEVRYIRNGISISDCKLNMQKVTVNFSDNFGVMIYGDANPFITQCAFNNLNEAPVHMDMFSNPVFSGNTTANVAQLGISLNGGTVSGTVPVRSFAGYDTITYLVNENIRVDDQLTIPSGLVFKSDNGAYFDIYGRLTVAGTVDKPVVFTTVRDDAFGKPGDTEQNGSVSVTNQGCRIIFRDQSDDNSSIDHAIFRYSRYYGISTTDASPLITHSIFYKNENYALGLSGSSAPAIRFCTFEDVPFPLSVSILAFPSAESDNLLIGTTGRGVLVKDNETLTQNATLGKRNFAGIANIPYIFNRYTIGTSAVLTISPGVVCKFMQNGYLTVRNGLIADGGSTPDSIIVFTSDRDDFYGGDTYGDGDALTATDHWWRGIYFPGESIDASCLMDNCVIKNASYHYSDNVHSYNRAGITLDNASPTIHNCLFTDDFWGILVRNTSVPDIDRCDFSGCDPAHGYAIWNETGTVEITAEYCWWNDDTGPWQPTLNPDGKGERVSGHVDFDPWITHPSIPVTGDVSLNGEVMPYDASLVLQHTVGNITLNASQQAVADVSKDGSISAYDASLILQYTVGLITGFDQGGKKSSFTGDLVTITIPSGTLSPETTDFEVPVILTTSKSIKSLEMIFSSNSGHLTFTGLKSDNLPAGIMNATGYKEDDGSIRIALTSAYDLNLTENRIILTFRVKNPEINESVIALKQIKGNETEEQGLSDVLTIYTGDAVTGMEETGIRRIKLYSRDSRIVAGLELLSKQPELVITVYDLSGRRTNRLILRNTPAGLHDFTFSPEENGRQYSHKLYIVTIRGQGFNITGKIVLR